MSHFTEFNRHKISFCSLRPFLIVKLMIELGGILKAMMQNDVNGDLQKVKKMNIFLSDLAEKINN